MFENKGLDPYKEYKFEVPPVNDLKDSGTRRDFTSGATRDAQGKKGSFHLIPPIVTFLLARVYEMGMVKYASRNWEKGMPISVYVDCAKRHLDKYLMGLRDEPHLSQALWNISGALWTASMVHLGLRDAALNDMPNHVGVLAWKGQVKTNNWEVPPLSPSEIESIRGFGISTELLAEESAKQSGV